MGCDGHDREQQTLPGKAVLYPEDFILHIPHTTSDFVTGTCIKLVLLWMAELFIILLG